MKGRAEWHFGQGPDYCRGCAALDRDCGLECPYTAHSPASAEGAAVWAAGTACVTVSMVGPGLDMAGALAAAREMDASGWAAVELLAAFRTGLNAAMAQRTRTADAGGLAHGG